MFYSNSYLGTRGIKSSTRRTFVTFDTDGKLPLVLSQIHTSEQTAPINKGTLTLRINTRLWAAKARWLSAIQRKQSSSEIRFPDLIHWPTNCRGFQWYSNLDTWHTLKIICQRLLIPQKCHRVFSPIFTTNLLLELNMSFSIGNFPMFKKQKNLLENVWNKQNKTKTKHLSILKQITLNDNNMLVSKVGMFNQQGSLGIIY